MRAPAAAAPHRRCSGGRSSANAAGRTSADGGTHRRPGRLRRGGARSCWPRLGLADDDDPSPTRTARKRGRRRAVRPQRRRDAGRARARAAESGLTDARRAAPRRPRARRAPTKIGEADDEDAAARARTAPGGPAAAAQSPTRMPADAGPSLPRLHHRLRRGGRRRGVCATPTS